VVRSLLVLNPPSRISAACPVGRPARLRGVAPCSRPSSLEVARPSDAPSPENPLPGEPFPSWLSPFGSLLTSSPGSTLASVRLRRFSRPWRLAPLRARWSFSTTHAHGVRAPATPIRCPSSGPLDPPVGARGMGTAASCSRSVGVSVRRPRLVCTWYRSIACARAVLGRASPPSAAPVTEVTVPAPAPPDVCRTEARARQAVRSPRPFERGAHSAGVASLASSPTPKLGFPCSVAASHRVTFLPPRRKVRLRSRSGPLSRVCPFAAAGFACLRPSAATRGSLRPADHPLPAPRTRIHL
jgi:hypothetical protein